MINFPVVDTHVHVWDLDRLRYPWLDRCPSINRTFLLNDFDTARGPIEVEKLVFVQCECLPKQHLDELRWVQSLANGDPRIWGIVPWAPLESGDEVSEELRQMASDPRVKGVRRIIMSEADVNFCIRPGFTRGVQLLGEMDLHFEITIAPIHMPNTLELIRRCPGVSFILDHLGNPDIAGSVLEPWATHLREMASFENVWCKVSGLATNANLESWKREDFVPYLDTVFEAFGTHRVVYASDWPHALRATDYVRWFETLDWATRAWDEASRRRLFHDNAVQFYRLG